MRTIGRLSLIFSFDPLFHVCECFVNVVVCVCAKYVKIWLEDELVQLLLDKKKLTLNRTLLQLFTRFSLDFVRCWCNCGSLKMRDCVGVSEWGACVDKNVFVCVFHSLSHLLICVCVSVLFVKIVLDKIKPIRGKIHTIDGFGYSFFTVIHIFCCFLCIRFFCLRSVCVFTLI